MSLQRPLEGLLRPPVEWVSSVMTLALTALAAIYPKWFGFYDRFLDGLWLASVSFASWRGMQGYRVIRYQRQLKAMPTWLMPSKDVPVSSQKLFLGKGFCWNTQHTQRLRDLDLDYNLPYKCPHTAYRLIRQLAQWAERHHWGSRGRTWLNHPSRFNPFRPYPDIGGSPALHGVSEQETWIDMNLRDRASHIVVVGVPGVGKTRFAELLIAQDIRRGDVVIVIDPKGDADLLKRMYLEAKRAGREHQFKIFHLGFPSFSARYNPIGSFARVTEIANRIANQLPGSGDAASFKEFGWKFINTIAVALVALGERPTYKRIKYYISHLDKLLERYVQYWLPKVASDWETEVHALCQLPKDKRLPWIQGVMLYLDEHPELQNTVVDDLALACRYDRDYFSKITASLMPLLDKLTTGHIADLLSPDYHNDSDDRGILDWLQVIRNGEVVYVGLDALSDPVVSSAVGNAMFSDFVSVAGRLYNNGLHQGFYRTVAARTSLPRICIHSDEFNELIGDEFIPLLNKGRGAGFTVTAYTQTWSDVEARLQQVAKAGQVAGNLANVVMFRTKEAKTVNMLLEQLPTVPILRVVPGSSSNDTPHGEGGIFYQSSNEDRFAHQEVRLIEQNDVLNLPIGHAFCLLEGGKLYKLRVPLPDGVADGFLPSHIESLAREMKDKATQPSRLGEGSKS